MSIGSGVLPVACLVTILTGAELNRRLEFSAVDRASVVYGSHCPVRGTGSSRSLPPTVMIGAGRSTPSLIERTGKGGPRLDRRRFQSLEWERLETRLALSTVSAHPASQIRALNTVPVVSGPQASRIESKVETAFNSFRVDYFATLNVYLTPPNNTNMMAHGCRSRRGRASWSTSWPRRSPRRFAPCAGEHRCPAPRASAD